MSSRQFSESGDGDRLGEKLAEEARATRPAFNAALHRRIMESMQTAPSFREPTRIPFSYTRLAALVAFMICGGVLGLALASRIKPGVSGQGADPIADIQLPIQEKEEKVQPVDPARAKSARNLLALVRVNPMKMLDSMAGAEPEPTAEEKPANAVADAFSIRLLSRSPFIDFGVPAPLQLKNRSKDN